MESRISTHLIVDYAEFLTWLAGQIVRVVAAPDTYDCEVRHTNRAFMAGVYGFSGEDWHYALVVNATLVRGWTKGSVDLGYMAVEIPLTARAEDGWRPYYAPRKPSWDPQHGLPTPVFRAQSGRFTVFEFPPDPWELMKRNPKIAQLPTAGASMELAVYEWVALAEFLRWRGALPDDEHRLDDTARTIASAAAQTQRYTWGKGPVHNRVYQSRSGLWFRKDNDW